jgi:uncharacterized protein (DUF2141 family)
LPNKKNYIFLNKLKKMKKITLITMLFFAAAFIIISCKKDTVTPTDPCVGLTISINTTQSAPTTGQSNGSITITATPSGTYTYAINNGAYQSSNIFNNLAAGTYTIKAKNADGCESSASTVTLTATNPCTGVTITINTTQTSPTTGQNNGSITVSASPNGTYTYNINNGAYQPSNIFNNLAAGTYTIKAKNSIGCESSASSVTLTAIDPCSGINIVLTPTTSFADLCPTVNNGSITLTASGSTGFTYSKDGGTTFQASNVFSNLAAGNYPVVVKDVNGCTKSQTVTVSSNPGGTNFNLVRNLMIARCGSCHFNNASDGGVNFDDKCNIVTKWDRINTRCVIQTTNTMPPNPLSTTEKQTITNWVNAGHRYID